MHGDAILLHLTGIALSFDEMFFTSSRDLTRVTVLYTHCGNITLTKTLAVSAPNIVQI
jgi:hypothetical protein